MTLSAPHSAAQIGAWVLAAGLCICTLALGWPAHALEVRVRAKSALSANVTAAGTSVHVAGSLSDELSEGLPQRRVHIVYRPESVEEGGEVVDETLHTDRRGSFSTTRELAPGAWMVEVFFEETEHVTASRIARSVELQPAPVELRLQAPPRVVGTAASVPLGARATVAGVGLSTGAQISVNGRGVGQLDLDQFGRGSTDVAPHLRPGMNDITVRIAGTRHRMPVEETTTIRLSEELKVDAHFEQVVERLQRGLALDGHVGDGLGPIEGMRVSVRLRSEADRQPPEDETESRRNDEHARFERFVTTGDDGSFHAFFPGDALEDGVWMAETTVVPEVGQQLSVATEPVELDRRTSRWLLNGLGLLGLIGGVALILQRLWQVIHTYVQRRRHERQSRTRTEEAFSETERLEPRQLAAGEPPIDREPDRRRVSGLVWDVWKDQPVPNAQVAITAGGGDEPLRTQASSEGDEMRPGAFVFDDLEPGNYVLEIDATGFMPGKLEFRIPHTGSLSNVRLDVVAVPLKVRRLYQSLVHTLEGEDLWGKLSPRQIEQTLVRSVDRMHPPQDSVARREFVRALRRRLADAPEQIGGEGLAAMMTELVEETYFSGRVYDESVWRLARDIAVRLRERLGEAEGRTP